MPYHYNTSRLKTGVWNVFSIYDTQLHLCWTEKLKNKWISKRKIQRSFYFYAETKRPCLSLVFYSLSCLLDMMTSSNGNIFHVTGPLCREFTGHRWIPLKKASDAELYCLFGLRLNKRLGKQSWGLWYETPLRSSWRHRNDYICYTHCMLGVSFTNRDQLNLRWDQDIVKWLHLHKIWCNYPCMPWQQLQFRVVAWIGY